MMAAEEFTPDPWATREGRLVPRVRTEYVPPCQGPGCELWLPEELPIPWIRLEAEYYQPEPGAVRRVDVRGLWFCSWGHVAMWAATRARALGQRMAESSPTSSIVDADVPNVGG